MKRSIAAAIAAALLVALAAVCCAGCTHGEWNDGSYDLSLPDIGKITATSGVSEEGWYLVFEDEFDKGDTNSSNLQSALNAIWTTSPEGVRWESNDKDKPEQACYWCADMVSVADGYVTVRSQQKSDHVCFRHRNARHHRGRGQRGGKQGAGGRSPLCPGVRIF